MPDVEVKLNIEAEYKQALAAIAAMAKALDAVKAKADALKGALGSAGGGSDTKPDAGSAEAINALNKANRELAQALLLVNQTAEKAKAALAGFSEISGVTPDMVDSLRMAAAEFDRVAAGALQAAESAAKFNSALSPGTEQLMKQAEAIKAQVAALQETVELTQKQLEQRINLTAILNESIDLHKQETEEIGRNTEAHEDNQRSRKRNTEDSEKERFEMELSLLTRQQLLEKIKELTKARQEAAEAEDQENYELYTRQLSQAHAQLRKMNMEMNVQRMMYLQQAQAVRAMGDTFTELGDNISNIGENAEEGELDLVGMAEGAMELFNQLQAGMGPIGWFMLALKVLQNVLNSTAKAQKELAAEAKKTTEDLAEVATANDSVSRSIQTAIEQENLENRLATLKTQYDAVNTALDKRIKLIDKAKTDADKERSRMAAEEEHQRNLLRLELERKKIAGEISREEYDKTLQDFKFDADVKGAQREAERKRAAANAAAEKAKLMADAAQKAKDKATQKREERSTFTVTEETVTELDNAVSKIGEKREKAGEELETHRDSLDYGVLNGLGDLQDDFFELLGFNEDDVLTEYETWEKKLDKLNDKYSLLTDEYLKALKARFEKLKGLSSEEYLRELELIKEELAIALDEEKEAIKKAEDAAAAAAKAEEEATEAEAYAVDVARRTEETRVAVAKTEETRKAAQEAAKKVAKKKANFEENLLKYSDPQLEKIEKEAAAKVSDTEEGKEWLQIRDTAQREMGRRARVKQAEKDISWMEGIKKQGKRAFVGEEGYENLQKLLDMYMRIKQSETRNDDNLYNLILKLIDVDKIKDKKQKARFKRLQDAMVK